MRILISILIVLTSWPLLSQVSYHSEFEKLAFESQDPLKIIIGSDPEISFTQYTEIRNELDDLLSKVRDKKEKYARTDEFLEWAFYYTHRKMLGWYENYVSFSELFRTGKYDCLTGTILYSVILNDLEIPYTIHEFDYHIFLVANLPGKDILIEATDPLDGFIKDHSEIQERVEDFISSNEKDSSPIGVGHSQKDLHGSKSVKESIDLQKLAGLQYYNLAIKSFNLQNYKDAVNFINKAEVLYPCDRIFEVKDLMVKTL